MVPYRILRSYFLGCALLVTVARAEEVFNTTPPTVRTSFSCYNRPMGFYADVEANCRVYHMCDNHGNKFSYRCPEETAFRQDALICDHAHLVNCQATVYPSNRSPSENIDKDNVIQRPDKSAPKLQPGFVFSASLFLRDRDRGRDRCGQQTPLDTPKICNVDSNHVTTSTARTERFDYWDSLKDKPSPPRQLQTLSSSDSRVPVVDKSIAYLRRSFETTSSPTSAPAVALGLTQPPLLPPHRRSSPSHNNDYRSYSETLKSIQANAARTTSVQPLKSTTEIPVHALTLSLKPLIPNELEYDPYYPKQPTSTEAYYTPSDANTRLPNFRQTSTAARFNLPFEIPSVLPDLNSLEDLIDRRRFFYIPRANLKSITQH